MLADDVRVRYNGHNVCEHQRVTHCLVSRSGGDVSSLYRAKLATRSVSCGFVIGSGSSTIFVDHSTEDAVAAYWGINPDDDSRIVVGWAVLAALVRTVIIKVLGELVEHGRGVAFVVDQHPVGALDRTVRTNRSA